ncbi:MAG: phosphatidylserine decarboxylase [Alphaproteobacteria bacterium]|nr:phosphatidylserine decarboxylase [Alphaproteobacteria bacterium]
MLKNYPDWTKAIYKDGYIFICIGAAITFLLASASTSIGWMCFFATVWCAYFFRNPERVAPSGDNLVISPADGIIQNIISSKPPAELGLEEEEMIRVSIVLNLLNVHVNRIPADGKIIKLHYHPGRFFNASLDKASIHNERQSVLMENYSGNKIIFVQIAGVIAKRIVCDLEESANVSAGQRFGIIRFGSRVDLYLPIDTKIKVGIGQTTVAGETIIADFADGESNPIIFEIR